MFDLAHVFQLVIDGLNKGPLPEHDPVLKEHQGVLHVLFDLCDQMYAVHEKLFEEILSDVALVAE